jgi:polyhydroxybutyrate depolymerase
MTRQIIATLGGAVLWSTGHDARAALDAGTHANRTLDSGGYSRLYDVIVPASYDGQTPLPLVLDFHGYGSSKTQERVASGFNAVAEREGVVVVYPQGLFGRPEAPEAGNLPAGPSWNGGAFCCGDAKRLEIDDVAFARALVDAVAAEVRIDRRRVYATGLSNGGAMTHRLACEAADVFAAAAPLAFPLHVDPPSACLPARPIPVLHFAGLSDSLVPYDGGAILLSAQESFAMWREIDGCAAGPPNETVDLGKSFCETYSGCADGVEVGLCSIKALDVAPFPGHVLWFNEDDLRLGDMAWAFLSRFTLESSCATGDATSCETELIALQCDGAPLPTKLQRLVRKKIGRARTLLRRSDDASDVERADRLRRKALRQLDAIAARAALAVEDASPRRHISSACRDAIDALLIQRRALIGGSPSTAFVDITPDVLW